MKREFSFNLLILLGLNLIVKPLYIFGIDIQVQNTLGPEQYGLFFSIYNYTLLFQILLEFGITNLVKRDVAENNELATDYFSGLLGVKMWLCLLYIVVTLLSGMAIGYDSEHFLILAGMMGIQICMTFISFARAVLAGYGLYKIDSFLSVFDKIIMILILGFILYGTSSFLLDLKTFVSVYLISVFMCAVIGIYLCYKNIPFTSFKINNSKFYDFVKLAFPYAMITFLMSIYGRIDAVFLERLLPDGNYQAGVYAAGFRLLDVYMIFALLFSNLLLPMLSRNLADKEKMQQLLHFVVGLLMTFTITGAVAGFTYMDEISQLLYHTNEKEWISTIGILIICIVPVGLSLIYGAAILAIGKLRKQNYLFIAGVILSVVFNFILIPDLKSKGAAYTALGVNLIISIGQIIIFYAESQLKFLISFYLRLLTFILFTVIIFFGLNLIEINWILAIITGSLISLVSSMFLALFPRELMALRKLFSKEN